MLTWALFPLYRWMLRSDAAYLHTHHLRPVLMPSPPWSSGVYDYSERYIVIRKALEGVSKIFLKGGQKEKWLEKLLNDKIGFSIFNLELFACPPLKECLRRYLYACDHVSLAAQNVIALYEWIITNRPDLFTEEKKNIVPLHDNNTSHFLWCDVISSTMSECHKYALGLLERHYDANRRSCRSSSNCSCQCGDAHQTRDAWKHQSRFEKVAWSRLCAIILDTETLSHLPVAFFLPLGAVVRGGSRFR